MLGFRPKSAGLYLERPRLLNLLPDEPGYVVWLEAPYGYGKSVLASQWANALESQGWRVVWLAVGGREPKAALAQLLALSADSPWGVLLDALWAERTLLVLEDLESLPSHESLSSLLRDLRGLLLLASRNPLLSAELPRLVTENRLVRLDAGALAFNPEETVVLFDDQARAGQTWRRTQGWPLPLHFAALTGELPERGALLEGIRESLEEAEWEEALLLATVSYLPEAAAQAATERLAKSGFAQRIEVGYRLHTLVGEAILRAYAKAVKSVILREAARLPPVLRGEAFERSGLYTALGQLLDTPGGSLARQVPEAVLRWDALAPEPRGAARRRLVGWSLCSLGELQRGIDTLLETTRLPNLSADELLSCYRDAVWFLAQTQDFARAREVEAAAATLLEYGDPDIVGAYLNNLFLIHFESGDWEEAAATLRSALEYYPSTSPKRAISTGNLAVVKWHQSGDVEALRLGRSQALSSNQKHNPSNVPGDHLQLGEIAFLLGERNEALAHCREAQAWAKASPRWALEAEALGARLEQDTTRFPGIFARAEAWQDESLVDRIHFFWANALLDQHNPQAALEVLAGQQGYWTGVARALALGSANQKQALVALGEMPSARRYMEDRLYWHAARYRITRKLEDLTAFLNLSLVHERLLPGLVSLAELPKDQPELARVYPLEEVLASGWQEAIKLRLGELPDLELSLLGEFSLRLFDLPLELTERQKQIVALFSLGLSREQVAEAMWPETGVTKQRNNLGVQLNLLRKVLEPWGLRTYLFEDGLKRLRSDYAELQAALGDADTGKILRLYKEPFAPGVDLEPIQNERGRLREEVIELLYEASQEAEATEASTYLTRVMELEPLHEEALQGLLTWLLAHGRRREAQQRYRQFQKILDEELGLEPLPETQALLQPR